MRRARTLPSAGLSLVEVLVTVVILAFGLLGIAALQAKVQVGSIEAYQRAQAIVLVDDMRARILGNSANAAAAFSQRASSCTSQSRFPEAARVSHPFHSGRVASTLGT